MNRAERRKQEKAERRAVAEIPEWKRREIMAKAEAAARLYRNGITEKDLQDAYDKGFSDAIKEKVVEQNKDYMTKFFYCAAALTCKRQLKFGEQRILRFMDSVHEIMREEITTADIIRRCKEETGIEMFETEYTI